MGTFTLRRRLVAAAAGLALFAGGMAAAGAFGPAEAQDAGEPAGAATTLPGFSKVVSLSHVGDPAKTPLFPGDPAFRIKAIFTVHHDGFYLEIVRQGMHTGTHYSAPCHFRRNGLCADQLDPGDLVLPAVVIDVREAVKQNPDHVVRIADLQAWEDEFGPMPKEAAVLLRTGCDRFWARGDADGRPNYYNCGSGLSGEHQPGFSRNAVKWLIETGVLGKRGALGTDTFGPDPSADASYTPSWLTLARHRVTIENLTNLGALPPVGAWIALGSPRNVNGSGAPGTVFAFIP
jgi:kynurenine formamidase